MKGSSQYLWWIGIFLVNLLLKGWYLTGNDIALDEPFSIWFSQQSMGELAELFPRENNPPLHYILLHYVIALFGIGPVAVRGLSLLFSCLAAVFIFRAGQRHFSLTTGLGATLLFSCLAAVFIFRAGQRHFSLTTGLGASLLFTLSNFHIYHSHEARTYSLLIFLTVMAVDAYLKVFDDPSRTRSFVWLGVWNTLLIYSHFLGFWLLMAQVAGILLARKRWPLFKGLLFTGIATLVAYIPYFYILYLRMGTYVESGTWVWRPQWTELYGNINRFLNSPYGTMAFALAVLGGLGMAWSLGRKGKEAGSQGLRPLLMDRKWMVLGFQFVLIYGGMYAVSFVISPQFLDRYLLFTTIPLFLFLVRTIDLLLPRKVIAWAGVGLIAVAMLVKIDINPSNERSSKALAAGIKELKQEGVPLIICPPHRDMPLLYHYDQEAFADYRNKEDYLEKNLIYPVVSVKELPPQLFTENDYVLYLDGESEFICPGNGIKQKLDEVYQIKDLREYDKVSWLRIYQRFVKPEGW